MDSKYRLTHILLNRRSYMATDIKTKTWQFVYIYNLCSFDIHFDWRAQGGRGSLKLYPVIKVWCMISSWKHNKSYRNERKCVCKGKMHADQTAFRLLHWISNFARDDVAVWRHSGAEANGESACRAPVIFKRKKRKYTVRWLKMLRECAAVECTALHVIFIVPCFPGKRSLMKAWIVNTKRLDLTTKKLWVLKLHDQLCSKHF